MAIINYTQVTQCFIYFVSILLASIFLVPMIMNVYDFEGKCLLFTTGVFNENDGRIFEPNWSSFSYCALTLFNGFALDIVAIIQLIRTIHLMKRGFTGSVIAIFWEATIAFVAFIFTLLNAILVTVGFTKWCNSLTQNFESCEDAADSNVLLIANTHINPERFYLEMGTVAFGIWSALIAWFFIFLISSLQFYEYHQKENLIISMARERRRYETISETIDEDS